ncbi:hypothetical protein GF373_16430, partial [bacterium]|nr:hypothetical protein [bacterium]
MMKISLLSQLLFSEKGEIRLLWLYIPAVFLHGVFSNFQTPVTEIIWDSVFYKSMAHGLYHITSFDLHHHFPVPPLYPLVLIPGFLADSYLTVEWIHSWINPLLYFLGLYPLYYYSRFLLTPQKSAFVCVVFLCYPSSVFAQWSMSENLAVPLVFASAYLAVRLLFASGREWKPGIFLGIVLAGIVLTRVFLVVYCGAILLWLGYRTLRKRNDPGPILATYSLFLTLVLVVWWLGGYFSLPGNAVVYADFNRLPLPTLIGHYFTYFFAHWTG